MKIYRALIDNFMIEFSETLKPKDFILKTEWFSANRLGKSANREKTKELTERLNNYFETKVEIPRIKHGNKQTIETLINEEAMLLAKYLRKKFHNGNPEQPHHNPFL